MKKYRIKFPVLVFFSKNYQKYILLIFLFYLSSIFLHPPLPHYPTPPAIHLYPPQPHYPPPPTILFYLPLPPVPSVPSSSPLPPAPSSLPHLFSPILLSSTLTTYALLFPKMLLRGLKSNQRPF